MKAWHLSRGSEASALTTNLEKNKKWCLKLKHIDLGQCYSHFIEAILCVTILHISNKPPSVAFIKGS